MSALEQRLADLRQARASANRQILVILNRTQGPLVALVEAAEIERVAAVERWRDHPNTLAARRRALFAAEGSYADPRSAA